VGQKTLSNLKGGKGDLSIMTTVNRIASINKADKDLKSDNTEDFQEDESLEDKDEGALDEGDNQEDHEDVTDKEASTTEVLPRFKGKTPAEISRAYEELETLHGRLANEVGDYRKMARDWLFNEQENSTKGKGKATKELTDEDFIDKPADAVSTLVADKIDPVTKRLDKIAVDLQVAEFQRKNPDYLEIVSNPEFSEWVKASPYRTRLYQKADAMDLEAGTELLQGYREVQQASKQSKEAKDKDLGKEKQLRKISSEKGGSSGGSGKKKIWSSAYLINLKITNPDKYNSIQPEVMQAYQEGRVK